MLASPELSIGAASGQRSTSEQFQETRSAAIDTTTAPAEFSSSFCHKMRLKFIRGRSDTAALLFGVEHHQFAPRGELYLGAPVVEELHAY